MSNVSIHMNPFVEDDKPRGAPANQSSTAVGKQVVVNPFSEDGEPRDAPVDRQSTAVGK